MLRTIDVNGLRHSDRQMWGVHLPRLVVDPWTQMLLYAARGLWETQDSNSHNIKSNRVIATNQKVTAVGECLPPWRLSRFHYYTGIKNHVRCRSYYMVAWRNHQLTTPMVSTNSASYRANFIGILACVRLASLGWSTVDRYARNARWVCYESTQWVQQSLFDFAEVNISVLQYNIKCWPPWAWWIDCWFFREMLYKWTAFLSKAYLLFRNNSRPIPSLQWLLKLPFSFCRQCQLW